MARVDESIVSSAGVVTSASGHVASAPGDGMRHIESHISLRQSEFAGHPFFSALESGEFLFEPCARALAFWVLSFQDVIELNAVRVRGSELRSIAEQHRSEDAHHEQWFLDDLTVLGAATPDARSLFSAEQAAVRAATYAIASEVFRAESDEERIVLILALEAGSHIFFERISAHLASHDERYSRLTYFARSHLAVEQDHDLFGGSHAYLARLELGNAQKERCILLVDRVYAAIGALFDALAALGSARG